MGVLLTDIADALDVSTATVSLALNGSGSVNAETRKQVTEMAEKLGYIPNTIARGLVRKKSGLLGLIIPDIENVYYSKLVKYIDNFSRQAGYRLFISISDNNPDVERETVSAMIANRVEGVVVVPVNVPNHTTDCFRLFRTNEIPFVFSTSLYLGIDAPFVMCDLEDGMYQLTRYLSGKNRYRHFALFTGPDDVSSLQPRERGFIRALGEETGASYEIIRMESVDYHDACDAAEEHLRSGRHADVIMCVNDIMAIGVINILARNGFSVPDDIVVTGFDDSLFATISVVTLTTVLQDIKEIARHSIEMLLKSIRKEELERKEVFIPVRVIKRTSTEGLTDATLARVK